MDEKWKRIVDRWPKWFQSWKGPFYFECDTGWADLIWNLCEKIERDAQTENFRITVTQVKEKFGGLRFYYVIDGKITDTTTAEAWTCIADAVQEAERQSLSICERCGKPGTPDERYYWLQTVCDEHKEERGQEIEKAGGKKRAVG